MKLLGYIILIGALAFGATTVLGVVDWSDTVNKASERVLGTGAVMGDGGTDSAKGGSGDSGSSSGRAGAGGSAPSSTQVPKYIASVTTSIENGVTRYHVRPTRAGRAILGDEVDQAWDQTVGLGVPNQAGLRQQFMCHPLSFIARGKRSWDLESWRPTVGLKRTMLAFCNPN